MSLRISFNKLGAFFEFRFGKKAIFNISFKQFFWGSSRTLGIRNNTSDGKRVIFLDYDDILLGEMLIPEIRYLQKTYDLGNFYIFKSSQKTNSYHAVCFDKVKVYEWKQILDDSSCDENYKKPALKDFKTCVLRIAEKGNSQKPSFCTELSSVSSRVGSLAHANFFKFHYDIDVNISKNYDNSDKLLFVDYATLNFIK